MSMFGVFDGHGGREVALFASQYLAKEFLSAKEFQMDNIDLALKHSFLSIDELVASPSSIEELQKLSLPPNENHLSHQSKSNESDMNETERKVSSYPIRMETFVDTGSDEEDEFGESNGFQRHPNGKSTRSISSRILSFMFPFGCLQSNKSTNKKIKKEKTARIRHLGRTGLVDRTDSLTPTTVVYNRPELSTSPQTTNEVTSAGCTAIVAVITKNSLHVANAGDSRCVLCREGEAIPMSRDHKPTDPDELSRIRTAGGFVFEGRVNGCLNLSRAIGDLEYKEPKDLPPEQQIITANPEIKSIQLSPGDQFVLLACDGIWDVLSHQQACDFVLEKLTSKKELYEICSELCDYCLAEDSAGSGEGCDNMTVAIVVLKEYYSIL
eukprot:g7424.t1